jgi:hypothetical protein
MLARPQPGVFGRGLGPLPSDWETFRVTWLCDSFSERSFQGL